MNDCLKTIWCCRSFAACVGMVLFFGCGSRPELPRYELSGEVTQGGKPVPSGLIAFQSLTATEGTADGFAPIHEGKFNTAEGGRGHFGGPHEVTITGTVLINPNNPDLGTTSLFEPYVVEMNFPYATTTQNFSVTE